jgi:hypothetical protein
MSKFYRKSLILILPILKMINEGITIADISQSLNKSKSLVSYHVQNLLRLGYLKEDVYDAFKGFALTQAGQNFVDQYEKKQHDIINHPICRLENIRFKADVLEMPNVPVDWEKIEMHNWVQYRSVVDDIRVHINLGQQPTVELIPSPADGQNPNDLLITVIQDCKNVLDDLEGRLGMRFGRLQRGSRPEFAIYNPIAKSISKYNGQVTVRGLGKINASKPRKTGEFEFDDPRAAAEFMAIPAVLNSLLEEIKELQRLVKQKNTQPDHRDEQ